MLHLLSTGGLAGVGSRHVVMDERGHASSQQQAHRGQAAIGAS